MSWVLGILNTRRAPTTPRPKCKIWIQTEPMWVASVQNIRKLNRKSIISAILPQYKLAESSKRMI